MPLFQPKAIFEGVHKITSEYLHEHGITALILDVDNTLTGHGSQQLSEEVAQWIIRMKQQGFQLMIASNNFEKRVAPFAKRIDVPHLSFCCKPFPFGLAKVCKKMGVSKKQIALVGDQIFTDTLGANLYGISAFLVQPVAQDKNWMVQLKRVLEKPILDQYYQKGGKLY